MKLGLYGGSFDPIHFGHILPVRHAMKALALDRVLYLPTARPPHKRERELTPVLARYTMVELALLDDPQMQVSDVEMDPTTVSYTVDTLRHFRREQPDVDLHLLLGSDSFLGLPNWREWRQLSKLAHLVVMARPGWEIIDLPPELAELLQSEQAQIVPQPVCVEASSSKLRKRLVAGESDLSDLTPQRVLDYIGKYEFYT